MSAQFDPYHRWLGIPREKQPANHYVLLALAPFEDDPDVIESAADQRMSHLRKFQTSEHSTLSQQLLNEVAAAKICLLDLGKKAAYDRKLGQQLAAKRPAIAKAVPLTPSPRPARQSPQESTVNPVAPIAALRTSARAGRRRRQSWYAPVVLGVLSAALLAGIGVVAISIWNEPVTTVAEPTNPRGAATRSAEQQPDGELKPPMPTGPDHQVAEKAGNTSLDPSMGPIEPLPTATPPAEKTDEPGGEVVPTLPGNPGEMGSGEDSDAGMEEQPGDTSLSDKRLPVANEAEQATSERRIREVFREDFAAARTAEAEVELAAELLQQGDETLDSPVDRFVLFRMAADLAAQGGDPELAQTAVDRIAGLYQADVPAMKADALQKAVESKSTNREAVEMIVDDAQRAAQEAIDDDDYPTATRLAKTGVSAARRTKDTALIRQAVTWSKDVERLEQRFQAIQRGLKVLADEPDNADANLVVGESYSFALERWEQGLPYLAKGSDAALAELARSDLDAPLASETRMELGNRWWELAKKQPPGDDRTAMMSRAAHWYELALPGLTDLSKTLAEKRLEEFAALSADASPGKKKGLYALAFDGQKSHVVVSNFRYDGATPLTVEAVVVSASVDGSATIVGNIAEGGWGLGVFDLSRFGLQGHHWAFLFRTVGGFGGRSSSAGSGSNSPAVAKQRVMLAAVYDGQQTRFYLNGKQQAFAPPARGRHRPGAQLLVIGGAPGAGGAPTNLFHGVIEQVRVSFTARYAADYSPPTRLEKDKATELLFDFDEGTGKIVRDSSGNKHHGKILDAEWVKRQ